MWTDQTSGAIRQLVQSFGTLLLTLGWITQGTLDGWLTFVCQVVGPLLILFAYFWSWRANLKQSIVAAASAIPAVKRMTISDPKLADAAKRADPGTIVNGV